MQIFGMPLWPEKISDEQYVERTRKQMHKLYRWRFIFALAGLGLLIGFLFLIFQAVHLLDDFLVMGQTTKNHAPDAGQQRTVYAVYYLALMMGGFVGLMFGNTISHIAMILFACRKDKLLVEFWDSLSDTEKARLRQTSS